MTFDELCRAVHQVAGEIGHAVPYELVQQMMGDELVQEVQKQGARVRRSKKTRRPPARVSDRKRARRDALQQHNLAMRNYLRTRNIRSLEQEMKLSADPFWQAARPAGIKIENLPHLAEALDWLRRHQPKAHWQLTEFWVERLRDLWESGKLREFQEALQVWVGLHAENCAVYQLVRPLQKR